MSLPDRDTGATYQALNKVDYQNLPPADPTVDWSNPFIAPAFCNVAGLTQTAIRAHLSMVLASSSSSLVLSSWYSVWMNATPTIPILGRTTTGTFTITFPTTVSDEYNNSFNIVNTHYVVFSRGWAQIQNSGGLYATSVVPSSNVLTVKLYNSSNALSDFAGLILDVFGC
jgi:hypothetical protein